MPLFFNMVYKLVDTFVSVFLHEFYNVASVEDKQQRETVTQPKHY